jgi:hypothetical protein
MVMILKSCSRANLKQASREAMEPCGESGSTSSQRSAAGGRLAAVARSVVGGGGEGEKGP